MGRKSQPVRQNQPTDEDILLSSLPVELAEPIRAVLADAANDSSWDQLDEAARALNRPDEVAEIYRRLLDRDLPADVATRLGQRAVAFHDEWFDEPTLLASILRRVVRNEPNAEWAFERLSLLLTMQERWQDLLAEYDTALSGIVDSERRTKLLDEAARIAKDFASEPRRANDYLKQLVLIRLEDGQLAATLERRLEQQERHADLIDVWRARLPVLSPEEALATKVRIAERYLEQLKDATEALRATEEVLAEPANKAPGAQLLERIAARDSAPIATRKRALSNLRERYASEQRADDVIRILGVSLELAGDDEERVATHRELAEWLTASSQFEQAADHCAALLALAPETADIHVSLRSLSERTGRLDRYVVALTDAANAASAAELRIQYLLEAGAVSEERVKEYADAITLFSRVLADEQANRDAKLVASQRLSELLLGTEQMDRKLDVLELRADLERDKDARRQVLGHAAQLAEALGQQDRALGLWQLRMVDEPTDLTALDARIALLESLARWPALIEDLNRRVLHSPNEAGRRADLVRVAEVYEKELADLARAVETWERVESAFGANVETEDALARLFARAARYAELVAILERIVKAELSNVARRIDMRAWLGDTLRLYQADPLGALLSYEQGLLENPHHEACRMGLQALLDNPDCISDAAEILSTAYHTADDWNGILGLVELRLAQKASAVQTDILLEASQIAERRAQDLERATKYLCRAFALSPTAATEAKLLELGAATGLWHDIVEAYATALLHAFDDAHRIELFRQRGVLLDRNLEDPARALLAYRSIMELDARDLKAACALLRVAQKVEDWATLTQTLVSHTQARDELDSELVRTAESVIEIGPNWDEACSALATNIAAASEQLSPRIAHDLRRQLGLWHRDRRDDAVNAELVLRRAAVDHTSPETLRMLAQLQRAAPGPLLVQTLVALADATGNDLAALHEAGAVALNAVGDAKLALPILERTLDTAAEELVRLASESSGSQLGTLADRVAAASLDQLVGLALEAGAPRRALELLERGSAMPFDRQRRVALGFGAAELATLRLSDPDKAIELGCKILEEAPDHSSTIALLSMLYQETGRLQELFELRTAELELEPPLERRLFLRLDQARVLAELNQGYEARVQALEHNLAEQPGHSETVNRLAALFEESKAYDNLYQMLKSQGVRLAEAHDKANAASLWERAGDVALTLLEDADLALVAHGESVNLTPTARVLDKIAAIRKGRNEHQDAARALEQRLLLTAPELLLERRRTTYELAQALVLTSQASRAETFLLVGLKADPEAEDLRELLAQIYETALNWVGLAPLLAEGALHTANVERRVLYLKTAADIQRKKINALHAAIPLLEAAVELDHADRALRLTLADSLRLAGRFDDARQLLSALLTEFGRRRTPERAAVHYHLAKIARATGHFGEALEQLEAASSIQRSDPAILKLLGDVARENGELERAERAYRTLLLLIGRGNRQKTPATPFVHEEDALAIGQSSILFELYRIAQDMEQHERAKDLLDSALEEASLDPEEGVRLQAALREAGHFDLLLHALEQRLRVTDSAKEQAAILSEKAGVELRLGREEGAFQSRLFALEKLPSSTELLDAARELAAQLGKSEAFYAELVRLASDTAMTDPRVACSLWLTLGRTAELDEENLRKAAEYYRNAQATKGDPLKAFVALDRVLTALIATSEDSKTQEFQLQLREALQTFVAADEGAESTSELAQAYYRLARLDLLAGAFDSATSNLERTLELEHAPERVLKLLEETLLVTPSEELTKSQPLLRLLERVARETGDKRALFAALIAATKSDETNLDELREAIALAQELDDSAAHEALLRRIVDFSKAQNSVREVLWAVVDLADRCLAQNNPNEAGALMRAAVKSASDYERFDLELKLAQIEKEHLKNPKGSIKLFERLLEEAPSDARIWRPLFELYRQTNQVEKLETAISVTEEAVVDSGERNALRLEKVRLLLASKRVEAAEEALIAVLEQDPDSEEANSLLVDLYQSTNRQDELATLLQKRFDGARERDEATLVADAALQLARFQGQFDRRRAIETLEASLHWTSENREILATLLGLYEDGDESAERADAMEALLRLEKGRAAADLSLALAGLRQRQDDAPGIRRALEQGFHALPTDNTLRNLLFNFYRERADWVSLAEAMATHAETVETTELAVAEFCEAAELYYEQLGDAAKAADILERALVREPLGIELLNQFGKYVLQAGQPERALARVGAALESDGITSTTLATLLHMRAVLRAKQQPENVDSLQESINDLEQALLLGVKSGLEDLVAILERVRGLSHSATRTDLERAATLRLARLLPELNDAERAVKLLRDWIAGQPGDALAITELGDLAAAAQHWSAAVDAYQRLLEISGGEDRVRAVLRLADACERAGTPMQAREPLERVYAEFNEQHELRRRLRQMYEAAGAHRELALLMLNEAVQTADTQQKFELYSDAGGLLLQVPGEHTEAISAFTKALELRPFDHATTLRLAEVYVSAEQIQDAATLLDEAIQGHGKRRSVQLSELQHAMARVAKAAGDDDALFAWLDAALTSDRQNGTVAAELATLSMERGEFEVAIKALQLITLLKDPGPMSRAEAYLRQAMIANDRGDPKKAILLAKRALATDAAYEDARAFLAQLGE